MEIIKRMVMEVVEPSAKKKYAKQNRNLNSRLSTTRNTKVAIKKVETTTSNVEKGKAVMKPIAKIVGADITVEFGKSNFEKEKAVINHIKLEDDIDVAKNVLEDIKKKGQREKAVIENARAARKKLV